MNSFVDRVTFLSPLIHRQNEFFITNGTKTQWGYCHQWYTGKVTSFIANEIRHNDILIAMGTQARQLFLLPVVHKLSDISVCHYWYTGQETFLVAKGTKTQWHFGSHGYTGKATFLLPVIHKLSDISVCHHRYTSQEIFWLLIVQRHSDILVANSTHLDQHFHVSSM